MPPLHKEVSVHPYSYTYRAPRVKAACAYGRTFSAGLVTSAFSNISEADKSSLVRVAASTSWAFASWCQLEAWIFHSWSKPSYASKTAMRPDFSLLAPRGKSVRCISQWEEERNKYKVPKYFWRINPLYFGSSGCPPRENFGFVKTIYTGKLLYKLQIQNCKFVQTSVHLQDQEFIIAMSKLFSLSPPVIKPVLFRYKLNLLRWPTPKAVLKYLSTISVEITSNAIYLQDH